MKPSRRAKIKLFLVCSGLDRVNRGYESFTRECFEALSGEDELDVWLWKGGGTSKGREKRLWNWPRDSKVARFLGKITQRGPYFIEQLSFALSFLPRVSRLKPQVIYFSDGNLGNLLWHWRRLTRGKYRLLLSNGGPLLPPFSRWDFVQQVAPAHLETALASGEDPQKQALVPYGIEMPADYLPFASDQRRELRARLDLPPDKTIVLSVAAINKTHKRMDYLLSEVAALPAPRPFVLLLGHQDEETPLVEQLAAELLGEGNYALRTVSSALIKDYYRACDLFVLASLSEGLTRALLEAASHGMPCLCHDYGLTRYALEDYGAYADFSISGRLTQLLTAQITAPEGDPQSQARHHSIYARFSWQVLKNQYTDIIRKCAFQ